MSAKPLGAKHPISKQQAYLEPKTRSLPLNYPISVASTRATICRVSLVVQSSILIFSPGLSIPSHGTQSAAHARTHARSRKVSELSGTPAFHLLLILLCIPGLRARLEPVADHGRDKPARRRLVACLALPSTKRTNHFSSEDKQTNRGEKALYGISTPRQPRHRALFKQGTESRFASSVLPSVCMSVSILLQLAGGSKQPAHFQPTPGLSFLQSICRGSGLPSHPPVICRSRHEVGCRRSGPAADSCKKEISAAAGPRPRGRGPDPDHMLSSQMDSVGRPA